MKKRQILWTVFASNCLVEIYEYLLEESKSETVANSYCLKLLESVEFLASQPEAGQVEPLLQKLNQNSRYIIEGNYKIIYQYNGNEIIITDVFHSKQNPQKIKTRNKKSK